MEKRRIRLEINGVVCGLITQESEEYMESLAQEVGGMMKQVLDASPFVTRESAALTAALSYCDDARKNGKKAFDLQERVDELEVEAELWQEEKAKMEHPRPAEPDPILLKKLQGLEERNASLEETAGKLAQAEERAARLEEENAALLREVKEVRAKSRSSPEPEPRLRPDQNPTAKPGTKRKNPLRRGEEFEQEGFVSFFEKKG